MARVYTAVTLLLLSACSPKRPPNPPSERREFPGSGPSAASRLHHFTGRTMGTSYSVKVVAGELDDDALHKRIELVLEGANRIFSTYLSDSELGRFNRYKRTDWFPVSKDLAVVVRQALELSKASGGAFDPTVAPLVNLWGFGPGPRRKRPPPQEDIERLMKHVGFKKLKVRLDPPALAKTDPEATCDLSAIAKGYAVDLVAGFLERRGFSRYMVEVGGEVRAKGTNHKGSPWRIGVERPDSFGRLERIIYIRNAAVATSGDYYNYFEWEGVRYSHTIDPHTGWPVRHEPASVTVIRPSCAEADGLATTIEVLGPEDGFAFALERKLAVLLLCRTEGGISEKMTPSFKDYLH